MDYNKEHLWNQIINQPELSSWLKEQQITEKLVNKHFLTLCSYQQKITKCRHCPGLSACQQAIIGKHPVLEYNGCTIVIQYEPCVYDTQRQEQRELSQYLTWISCYPKVDNFDDIYVNDNRADILRQIQSVLNNYQNGSLTKGIYLYGPHGCGKSYLMAYLANKLTQMKAHVIFVYYPDLVRKLKSFIGTRDLEDIVEQLKETEILIFDDFGGETMSNFIRDEVLGAVLQDRMVLNKPTFMTSNMDKKLLREHLADGNKDIDRLKASRIWERINTLMNFFQLKDNNYRK